MLTVKDSVWLVDTYPGLSANPERTMVEGLLTFSAAYDKQTGQFAIARVTNPQPIGVAISESYRIKIISRGESSFPLLYLDENQVRPTPDRHFNLNKSACVCGLMEEASFLREGFNFPRYLEERVVPFLYEQSYYDQYREWPWGEYAHDATGHLESYSLAGSIEFLPLMLERLKLLPEWKNIRSTLVGPLPKGHMPCFCPKHNRIRNCHPEAWHGLRKLYEDVRHSRTAIAALALPT